MPNNLSTSYLPYQAAMHASLAVGGGAGEFPEHADHLSGSVLRSAVASASGHEHSLCGPHSCASPAYGGPKATAGALTLPGPTSGNDLLIKYHERAGMGGHTGPTKPVTEVCGFQILTKAYL